MVGARVGGVGRHMKKISRDSEWKGIIMASPSKAGLHADVFALALPKVTLDGNLHPVVCHELCISRLEAHLIHVTSMPLPPLQLPGDLRWVQVSFQNLNT